MRLVGERNEWYTRYMSAIKNPDFMPAGGDAVPTAGTYLELDAVDGPGIYFFKNILHLNVDTDVLEGNKCSMALVGMRMCC